MDDHAQNNPFAPPRTLVADVAITEGVELATRTSRFCAALIDALLAIALSIAVMLPMYGSNYYVLMAGSKLAVLAGTLIYVAIFYAIEGWFLYQRSQSVGKIVMGLRIVRTDGNAASFGRAFGLRLFLFGLLGRIPFVGPLVGFVDALFIFGESRRCLHDRLADTIVVTAISSEHAVRAA